MNNQQENAQIMHFIFVHALLTHSQSEQEQGRPFRPLIDTGRSHILLYGSQHSVIDLTV